MKTFNLLTFVFIPVLFVGTIACGQLGLRDESSDGDLNQSSPDQSEIESASTAVIEALTDSTSSADADTASLDSLSTSSLVSSAILSPRNRFQCADPAQVTEDCICDDVTGTQTCEITFNDCELKSTILVTVTLNGSFTREISNMGLGACDESDPSVVDLKIALQGRNGDKMSATYTVDELVRTYDARLSDREITATLSPANRTVVYEVVSSYDDGSPEEVLATVNRHWTLVTTDQDNNMLHDLEIDVSTASLSTTSGDTVQVSTATHRLFLDEDGMLEKRTIESGDLVARHYLGNKAFIFRVGDGGLTFDLSTSCRIDEGSLTIEAYTMDDNGTLEELYATGTLTFEGKTITVIFEDGDISANVYERGCL